MFEKGSNFRVLLKLRFFADVGLEFGHRPQQMMRKNNVIDASQHSIRFTKLPNMMSPTAPAVSPVPKYDPEVIGGDTCDLGQCCMNPCGWLFTKVLAPLLPTTTTAASQLLAQKAPLLFYFVVTYGVWDIILYFVYPLVDTAPNVPAYHKTIGYFVLLFCILSWLVACNVSPGSITKESLHRYDNYPYDNVLFKSKICPTLRIRKLARSKYDRYSDSHVPRYDHYCAAIGQTVGEENYRFFLMFLIIHTGMCYYGFIMVARILWDAVLLEHGQNNLLKKSGLSLATALPRLVAIGFQDTFLTALLIFLVVVAGSLTYFLGFHVYILYAGMTTNEYYKWKDVAHERKLQKSGDEESGSTTSKAGMSKNIYDNGACSNINEVVFPRSLRKRKSGHHVQ